MKIVFNSEYEMEQATNWMNKDENGNRFMCSQWGERVEVDTRSLEVVKAKGYEGVLARWLSDGVVRFMD